MPAYELAVAQRSDMIEIDLHRTRDGAVVITHDETLDHLGGTGEIADATLAAVRALDAGGGERVPTLDEVLDAFGARIPFNLEIKRGTNADYEGLEEIALEAAVCRDLLPQTLFSSFFDSVLGRLRQRSPDARLAVLVSPRAPDRWLERARAVRAEAVNPWKGLATPELIEAAHAEGLAVYPYTVDDSLELHRMLDLGVDGIFTNHPDRLRAILDDAPAGTGRGRVGADS